MPEITKNPLTLLLVRGCLTTECCFFMAVFSGNQFSNPGLASVAGTGIRNV
ncbi:hypothetical protein GGR07_000604 [Bacteroides pyogenes]|nr:hypothetical protein [Bacteroides pyogenes]SUV35712.1 Uncharacterised protein [Bacteroides pyogenes]